MPLKPSFLAAAFITGLLAHPAQAQTILGSAGSYAVMAGSTVTINGTTTVITGDLGRSSVVGASYTLNGAQAPITTQNQDDFTRAFTGLAAMAFTEDLSGKILGTTVGATVLAPGIYKFGSTAQLTGTLILDAQNQSNAVWVFQIGSTFTTTAGSAVTFTNLAAGSAASNGLFWQVGTASLFGANTAFKGNLLGGTAFSFGSGATITEGRVLTGTAQTITLDDNLINFVGANSGYSGGLAFIDAGNTITAIPEPSAYAAMAGTVMLGLAVWRRRRRGMAV